VESQLFLPFDLSMREIVLVYKSLEFSSHRIAEDDRVDILVMKRSQLYLACLSMLKIIQSAAAWEIVPLVVFRFFEFLVFDIPGISLQGLKVSAFFLVQVLHLQPLGTIAGADFCSVAVSVFVSLILPA